MILDTTTQVTAEKVRMDYMNLLVTQLHYQNPLEPMNTSDMSLQLAELAQLQKLEEMSGVFQQMLVASDRGQAATLIGKQVTFFPEGAENAIVGKTIGVEMIDSQVHLKVVYAAPIYYTVYDDEEGASVAATKSTTLDELEQADYLLPSDTITVYGIRPDGSAVGDGAGEKIELHSSPIIPALGEFLTIGGLLQKIADVFQVDGEQTCVATLLANGQVRITDKSTGNFKTDLQLEYNGQGSLYLPQYYEVKPPLEAITTITD